MPGAFQRPVIYSRHHKFLFVHLSRTGGTSLINLLFRHCQDLRPITPQHSSYLRAQEVLGAELASFYTFAVVRNPWDRLHSWFALLSRQAGQAPEAIADPAHRYWQGFDSFLALWLDKQRDHAGRLVPELSQSAQLSNADGALAVDHIARFENYAAEIHALCERFGWQIDALTRANVGPKREHYRHYYTAFGAQLVADRLSEDIAQFGYDFGDNSAP